MAEEKLWIINEAGEDRMVCVVQPQDFNAESAETNQMVTVEDVLTKDRFDVPFLRLLESK
jgi:hypothetical protein